MPRLDKQQRIEELARERTMLTVVSSGALIRELTSRGYFIRPQGRVTEQAHQWVIGKEVSDYLNAAKCENSVKGA